MKTLTIVKEDNAVYIDGMAREVDCSSLPADVHAVQWDAEASYGEVEFVTTRDPVTKRQARQPNAAFTDVTPYQAFVDAWSAANAS